MKIPLNMKFGLLLLIQACSWNELSRIEAASEKQSITANTPAQQGKREEQAQQDEREQQAQQGKREEQAQQRDASVKNTSSQFKQS